MLMENNFYCLGGVFQEQPIIVVLFFCTEFEAIPDSSLIKATCLVLLSNPFFLILKFFEASKILYSAFASHKLAKRNTMISLGETYQKALSKPSRGLWPTLKTESIQ